MEKNKNFYNIETIYYTFGRNAKKIYDSIPKEEYDYGISKIEHYANKIGISTSFLYHIFSGTNTNQQPSFDTMLRIANIFNVKLDTLLEPLSDDEYEKFYNNIK